MPDENTRLLINALGAFFLGAVYLGGLIAAGLVWGSHAVVLMSLIAAGAGYLCQVIATFPETRISTLSAIGLWLAAVFAGTLAGMLLVGVGFGGG